jgi:thiamine biosynthesis lipoprotein
MTPRMNSLARLAGVLSFAWLAQAAPPALERFEFTEPQMGMPVQITLFAPDEQSAVSAARAAYDHIRHLNQALSDYEDDSELTRLNRSSGSGRWVPVSHDLWTVLAAAQSLAKRTQGAFDVTVGPVVHLWRKARRDRRLPDATRLAAARALVGYEKLHLSRSSRAARLTLPQMRLDLGAIAKGYALDQALEVLRARGMARAIVFAGGDMVAGEPPPGKPGWRVALTLAAGTNNQPQDYVWLKQRALATSGDLYQHLEIDGVRYSHIADPRTGLGIVDRSQVTVIARRGMQADSLATAVSVLGPVRGLALAKRTRGVEARILRQPNQQTEGYESRGFRQFLVRD